MFNRVKQHLADPGPHHRLIFTNFLLVSFFVIVGKFAGAAKEMTLAWRYGVSELVDAYVFSFNLVTWPIAVWFSILNIVLIPLISRISQESPAELPRFRGEFFALTLILGGGGGVIVWFVLPWFLSSSWVGLPSNVQLEALQMVDFMVLLIPLGIVAGLFSVLMLASGRHINTLYEAIPAVVILIALVLPTSWLSEPLLWGTLVGFVLHAVFLVISLKKKGQFNGPKFSLSSSVWLGFWGGVGITAVGQVAMSFTVIIDQFFVAGLGTGVLSSMSYANRILGLILGVGAMSIGRATLPIFSEVSAKEPEKIKPLAIYWAKIMFVVSVILIAIIWIASENIVQFLFERGAFHKENTGIVAEMLRFGLMQVPFYMAGLVFVSALTSMRMYRIIAIIAVVNLGIKLALNYFLVEQFNVLGIYTATAIMIACSAFFSYMALIKLNFSN